MTITHVVQFSGHDGRAVHQLYAVAHHESQHLTASVYPSHLAHDSPPYYLHVLSTRYVYESHRRGRADPGSDQGQGRGDLRGVTAAVFRVFVGVVDHLRLPEPTQQVRALAYEGRIHAFMYRYMNYTLLLLYCGYVAE